MNDDTNLAGIDEKRSTAGRIYANSFRWLTAALALNASLLAYGLIFGDGSTPREVVLADTLFLVFSIVLLPLGLKRSKWALYMGLVLGVILLMRSIRDPDFEEAFEEPVARLSELGYLVLFTVSSFVQTLSAYGAAILGRTGVTR